MMCVISTNKDEVPDEALQQSAEWLAENEQAFEEAKSFVERYEAITDFVEKWRF